MEKPIVRAIALALAVLLFIIGLAVSLRAQPQLLDGLVFSTWVAVIALVPITISLNAVQFWLTARLIGLSIGARTAVAVTVISTAANLLPLPGGAAVRMVALKKAGYGYGRPALLTLLVAILWSGVAAGIVSVSLIVLAEGGLAALAGSISAVALIGSVIGLRSRFGAPAVWCLTVIAVQSLLSVVGALRLWLCFQALEEPVRLLETLVLLFSSVVTAFTGIAPGGLGITELTAAGIAALIGVAPATAFVAAAVNRVSGLLVVAPLALILSVRVSRRDHANRVKSDIGGAK